MPARHRHVLKGYSASGPTEVGVFEAPSWYKNGSKPLVVLAHGWDYAAANAGIDYIGNTVAEAYMDFGYPTLSADWGGGSTWGNDTSASRVLDGINYAQANLGAKSGPVILYGGSMGAATVFNFARLYPAKVLCITAAIPLLDLQYVHDVTPGNSQNGVTALAYLQQNPATTIESSAGGVSALTDAYYAAHSANRFITSSWAIPTKLWYSPNDMIVGLFAPNLSASIPTVQATPIPAQAGIGHGTVGIDPTAVVSFAGQYG